MRAQYSLELGVLVFDARDPSSRSGVVLETGHSVSADVLNRLPEPLLRWESISGNDAETIQQRATEHCDLEHCFLLLVSALTGLSAPLESRALSEIERKLQTAVSAEKLLNRILIAPFSKLDQLRQLTVRALSEGLGAIVNVLEESRIHQVSARRVSDAWLRLDEALFNSTSLSRSEFWLLLSQQCLLVGIFNATTKNDFMNLCSTILLTLPNAQERVSANAIFSSFSKELFPHEENEELEFELDEREVSEDPEYKNERPHDSFIRAQKEIDEIVRRISLGDDNLARDFLWQLVGRQVSSPSGKSFAIKSLCNVAQRCVEMYRHDFESICLKRALEIEPYDSWTLIQFGNHLKRVGKFPEAITIFTLAGKHGEPTLSLSNIADVYSQMGEYERARELHRQIPNWHQEPVARTALGDLYRREGKVVESEREYVEALSLYAAFEQSSATILESSRPQIGMAELDKFRDNLTSALKIYDDVLARLRKARRGQMTSEFASVSDGHVFRIYCLGRAHVLKRMGNYVEALRQTDEVLTNAPFSMEAKLTRSSILGLMERDADALNIEAFEQSSVIDQWQKNYFLGLLNLRLGRFVEARRALVDEATSLRITGPELEATRLASAVYFLANNEPEEADRVLDSISVSADSYAVYLMSVIREHSSALVDKRLRTERPDALLKCTDLELKNAWLAVQRRDFEQASRIESSVLLKLIV